MKIATIARNPINSPNMTTNDAAILECITKELIALGNEVFTIDETMDIPEGTDIVCHMSRSNDVLEKLKVAEQNGIKVINSSNSVKNCSRIEFMRILEANTIPQPEFCVIEDIKDLDTRPFPAWIKRGDGWSCHKDDVCYSTSKEDAEKAIEMMHQRGITSCVYTQHCEGDIIKFYGIGEDYFTYSYPMANSTKFGLERINGESKHYPFDSKEMHRTVLKAAKAIGLEIYGGDCIVDANGKFQLIDINDFPSFSTVREEAAKEIALLITNTKKDERRR